MEMKKSTQLLCGLLIRGYKPEYYALLEEEMFSEERDRKVFRALRDGYRYSGYDVLGLRDAAGLTASETAELVLQMGMVKQWLKEKDIMDFAREYRERKISKLVREGKFEEALEYKNKRPVMVTGVIDDYMRSLQEKRSRADMGLLGLPTGIASLDRVTSGLQPGKVWIVGGYNAYGKTYLMTNMINRLVDMGRRACVLTLEMTKEDIVDRMIAERLSLSVYELAKTQNREEVERQVAFLKEHIEKGHLVIDDSSYDIEDIVRRLRLENANQKVDVVFLDFIQLVQMREARSLYEVISRVASRLQEITKELGVCFVILSQISNEAQRDSSSGVYGFKGAGEIGQVADVAIRIQRYSSVDGEGFTDDYDLNVVKNRSGRTGVIPCKITFPGGSITQRDIV